MIKIHGNGGKTETKKDKDETRRRGYRDSETGKIREKDNNGEKERRVQQKKMGKDEKK